MKKKNNTMNRSQINHLNSALQTDANNIICSFTNQNSLVPLPKPPLILFLKRKFEKQYYSVEWKNECEIIIAWVYNISVTISWAKCEIYIYIFPMSACRFREIDRNELAVVASIQSIHIYIYILFAVYKWFFILS